MFHYSRWRVLLSLGAVVLALVLALPNVLTSDHQKFVSDKFGIHPMTLGLDLQGGSNILMEVDQKDLTDKVQQQLMGDIRSVLREQKIGYSGLNKNDVGVSVTLNKPEDADRAAPALQKLLQPVDSGILSVGTAVNLFALNQNGLHAFRAAIERTC